MTESSIIAPAGIPSTFCSASAVPEEFKTEIMKSFCLDDVGKMCTTDEVILGYGCREFQNFQQKKDKRDERKAALRSDMRNLGRLYTHFKEKCQESNVHSSSAMDMFQRKNFKILEAAITLLTAKDDGGSKSSLSLKISLGYPLKKVAKYIHGEHLIAEKEEEALQIERFLAVLKFLWRFLFGDAEYSISMQRQTQLRKPHNLPDKDEVNKLRQFTISKIKEIVDDAFAFMSQTEFSLLRDLVVCRLTLFNARRGGEPSRLLISEWKDAENRLWMGDVESVEAGKTGAPFDNR